MYKNTDIRNFYFENEIGVRIDCQKVNGSLFLYDPTGLGFEDEYTYEAVGDTYILNSKTAKQIPITGNLEFYDMTYDEYRNFVDFIIKASKLKLIYIPKYSYRKEFYRDIDFASIQKMDEDDTISTKAWTAIRKKYGLKIHDDGVKKAYDASLKN